jgi:hypothetical protein
VSIQRKSVSVTAIIVLVLAAVAAETAIIVLVLAAVAAEVAPVAAQQT